MKEYIAYLRAFNVTPTAMQNKNGIAYAIIKLYLLVVATCFVIVKSGNAVSLFYLFTLLMAISVAGMYYQVKPSVTSIMPIGYKKRTAFYFINCVVMAVVSWITILAVLALITGCITLLLCLTGEFGTSSPSSPEESITFAISAASAVYQIFACLFHFGCLAVLTRISERLRFFLLFVFYLVVNLIGGYTLGGIILAGNPAEEWNPLIVFACFDQLPNPWLAAGLCAVIGISVFVGSVFFILHKERPKEF